MSEERGTFQGPQPLFAVGQVLSHDLAEVMLLYLDHTIGEVGEEAPGLLASVRQGNGGVATKGLQLPLLAVPA